MAAYKAVLSRKLSKSSERRYVVIHPETGKLLDDSQGFGYKSLQKAYEGYDFKIQGEKQRRERKRVQEQVSRLILDHPGLSHQLEELAYRSHLTGDCLNLQDFQKLVISHCIRCEDYQITLHDLLKYW